MAVVGRIARAHGNRGQVIVNLDTDFPETRFRTGAELFVKRGAAVERMVVATVRFQRDRPVVGFDGVDSMNAAEALAGLELRIPADRLAALPDGSYYHHDLVGCVVSTTAGETVGEVEGVEGTAGGSRLIVKGPRGEVQVPFAIEICRVIDPAAKRIVIEPPEGLLDLNR